VYHHGSQPVTYGQILPVKLVAASSRLIPFKHSQVCLSLPSQVIIPS
jgi:hypothetical protein